MYLELTTEQQALREAVAFSRGLRPLLEADPGWWRQGMLSDGDWVAVNGALGAAGWIGMSWREELGLRGPAADFSPRVPDVPDLAVNPSAFAGDQEPLGQYLVPGVRGDTPCVDADRVPKRICSVDMRVNRSRQGPGAALAPCLRSGSRSRRAEAPVICARRVTVPRLAPPIDAIRVSADIDTADLGSLPNHVLDRALSGAESDERRLSGQISVMHGRIAILESAGIVSSDHILAIRRQEGVLSHQRETLLLRIGALRAERNRRTLRVLSNRGSQPPWIGLKTAGM